MAFEVEDKWPEGGTLKVRRDDISDREIFSQEINDRRGEGGGGNFDYRTLEAAAYAANILGLFARLRYEDDFVYKTGRDVISFEFRTKEMQEVASRTLRAYFGQQTVITA